MQSRKCYVLLADDYDGDTYVVGVYMLRFDAEAVITQNNMAEHAAKEWDANVDKYPPINIPDRPQFMDACYRPSNTESKEYLAWLTNKLDHEAALKDWLKLRVQLTDRRTAEIKEKFGKRPKIRYAMRIEESSIH